MFSDYRAFGQTESTIAVSGSFTAIEAASSTNPIPSVKGHLVVVALEDSVLSSVILRNPRQGYTPEQDVTLKAGAQMVGIQSFDLDSGRCQVFWFKS